ncbi:class I SAM-dependent methyltransferase [Chloroflexi bacterium TSY]|nr:class I SAM-dependent methyltransferase [Chloroflexi bacterium TSY]
MANVQLVHGEAVRYIFAPNTFDRAVLVTILGEIPDRRAALAAIFDALKPGGTLTITGVLLDPH